MKRIVILLCLILTTFLCSCGNPADKPKPSASPSPMVTPTPEQTEAPKPSEEPEATPQEEEAPEEPPVEEEPEEPPAPPQPQVIGKYTTKVLDANDGRLANMKLAAQSISGFVVDQGEVFSFNATVGEASAANGYKEAKIIVNGETQDGVGGGVCQVSSTLYNAADQAGMQIVERHDHGKDVGYVERGRDAAISYGTYDLKFKNVSDTSVTLQVIVDGSFVTAQILK